VGTVSCTHGLYITSTPNGDCRRVQGFGPSVRRFNNGSQTPTFTPSSPWHESIAGSQCTPLIQVKNPTPSVTMNVSTKRVPRRVSVASICPGESVGGAAEGAGAA
jgi:hypothetical protein